MNIKSSICLIVFLLVGFLIACDGGGESGTGSDNSGGNVLLDDSASDQGPGDTPTDDPTPPDSLNDFQSTMLGLINDARSQSRNCGSQFFNAAPGVIWDDRIEASAQLHSEDMAASHELSHTGSDGSDAGDRLLMENYDWFSWGENILFGLNNAGAAIDALLDSPSHCSILMSPSFLEVGAGSTKGSIGGNSSTFWTIVLATESN